MQKIKKLKTRVIWGFSPITRVVKNKKVYNRKREKHYLQSEV